MTTQNFRKLTFHLPVSLATMMATQLKMLMPKRETRVQFVTFSVEMFSAVEMIFKEQQIKKSFKTIRRSTTFKLKYKLTNLILSSTALSHTKLVKREFPHEIL